MGLKFDTLYRDEMLAIEAGEPFVTSKGVTLYLLPHWAPQWEEHHNTEYRKHRQLIDADVAYSDWPKEVREASRVAEFLTAVVSWDEEAAGGPCTPGNKAAAALNIPLRSEVLAETRRRKREHENGILSLGKGSAGSSPSGSSTPTSGRSDEATSSVVDQSPTT